MVTLPRLKNPDLDGIVPTRPAALRGFPTEAARQRRNATDPAAAHRRRARAAYEKPTGPKS